MKPTLGTRGGSLHHEQCISIFDVGEPGNGQNAGITSVSKLPLLLWLLPLDTSHHFPPLRLNQLLK